MSAALLGEAAKVFTELPAGSTARSKNERIVLMYGLASLWFSGAQDLARKAVVKHRERIFAQRGVAEWLRDNDIAQDD